MAINSKTTRVRQSIASEITRFSRAEMNEILGDNRHNHGVSEMVRKLKQGDGFFIVCEDSRRLSHVYMAAKQAGIKVAIRRRENDRGEMGYLIARPYND